MALVEKGTVSYFEVSGERRVFEYDKGAGKFVDTGVVEEHHVRFSCLVVGDAERFVTDVYHRENIVCEIHQVPR